MANVGRIKLGAQGLEVMGISAFYGPPKPDSGVTFLDTSDIYGPHTNEILLGKALKGGTREKVEMATKFGVRFVDRKIKVQGDPAYVRAACEASLKRLDIDCIDLYYQHRIDTRVPIEITMGELKKLVEEGKIKYIGLLEASPATIKSLMASTMDSKIDWSKPHVYNEDQEEDDGIEELKCLTTCNTHQVVPSSPTLNSKKRKVDDWEWIDELVLEQRTNVFGTYGVIQGVECIFIMDSGSGGNYVSQDLVSFLNLPMEDLNSPYHVCWVNHGATKLVTKRCLVEFSIGHQYADRIWCDVMQMDLCAVLLGRPWQWDRNVLYRGRENVYD